MSLAAGQALVTAVARGIDLAGAADDLRGQLQAYPDARIISLTQQTNVLTSWSGRTTLVAAIEYTPTETEV